MSMAQPSRTLASDAPLTGRGDRARLAASPPQTPRPDAEPPGPALGENAALWMLAVASLLSSLSAISAIFTPESESLLEAPQKISMAVASLTIILVMALYVKASNKQRITLVSLFILIIGNHLLFCTLWSLVFSAYPETAIVFAGWTPVVLAATAALLPPNQAQFLGLGFMSLSALVYVVGISVRPDLPHLVTLAMPRLLLAGGITTLLLYALAIFRASYSAMETRAAMAEETAESLSRAMDREKAANRMKDSFMRTMSHELLTPLNAVQGFTQMMRDESFGPLGSPYYADYAGRVLESAIALKAYVRQILHHVELHDPNRTASLEACDFLLALETLVDRARQEADVKRVDIACGPLPDGVLRAERHVFDLAVETMLGYALVRTPTGGGIKLSVECVRDQAHITVQDQGGALSAQDITRAYQDFGHLNDGLEAEAMGLRIFLGILRRAAMVLDGSIRVAPSEGGLLSCLTVSVERARLANAS